jgi:hypothetical protein
MKLPSTDGTNGSSRTHGYLGHQRPYRERVALAARHYAGGRAILHPTLAQSAFAYRVALSDVLNVRKAERNGHSKTERNGHNRAKPSLAEQLLQATPVERVAAAKALGVDAVWDTMVLPLVGNGKGME